MIRNISNDKCIKNRGKLTDCKISRTTGRTSQARTNVLQNVIFHGRRVLFTFTLPSSSLEILEAIFKSIGSKAVPAKLSAKLIVAITFIRSGVRGLA